MTRPAIAVLLICCAWLTAGCASVSLGEVGGSKFAVVGKPAAPLRLAYSQSGRGSPVVLIHGFGANSYTWRHLAPILASNHRVYALDLKGYGKSDKPLDENYSLQDQAALVGDFIRKRRLQNVTLVGHSFGGGIALMLALDKTPGIRNRVKRLVLIDTIAYPQKIPIFFGILRTPVVGQVSQTVVPPELQARAALRIAYLDDSKITNRDVAAYAEPLYSDGAKHALIQTAKQIVPDNLGALSEGYKNLGLPTLILWCPHDKIVPIAIGRRLHSDLPNSTFRVIRGCGHIPHEERPLATAREIQEFLNRR
ncbi:MAG: alpha/beta fold hydrolase [Methyloligellaceae bacterium]